MEAEKKVHMAGKNDARCNQKLRNDVIKDKFPDTKFDILKRLRKTIGSKSLRMIVRRQGSRSNLRPRESTRARLMHRLHERCRVKAVHKRHVNRLLTEYDKYTKF